MREGAWVWVRRSFGTLTIKSWAVGAFALGAGGCATVDLRPDRSAELVERYSKHGESVILIRGRRYRLGPENDIELRAESYPCVDVRGVPPPPQGQQADGKWGTLADSRTCNDTFEAPRSDVRA